MIEVTAPSIQHSFLGNLLKILIFRTVCYDAIYGGT
jgi:hypothetical protein